MSAPDLTNEDWLLLTSALRKGETRSNHLRVNVVGNQKVGKTTLIQRLQRELTSCRDRPTQPTEALDIDEITLRCVDNGAEKTKVWETEKRGTEI